MCGISGIIRFDSNVSEQEIKAMVLAQKHRGPDGEGIYINNNLAIGHNRLAIIDLKTGTQPMSNEKGDVWITFNGEIYNFKILRDILIKKGHIFKTHSDTESIIHAYEEWGTECVNKLNGMFSFCIVDYKKRLLFLARDHFGIKPLHYRIGKKYFAFASEINTLRKVNDTQPVGRLDSIELYLRYQYIPAPNTIFKTIFKLLPANYLVVNFDGTINDPVTYWNFEFKEHSGLTRKEWIDKTEYVIKESVSRHLISDVELGVFLSGGVDSTLIALNAGKLYKSKLKAFCIDFENPEYSEVEFAKIAAAKIGVDLHVETVNYSSLENLGDLVKNYGEPFGDSSMLPTYYVSKLARQYVPLVLSGDGGDEAFGGYLSYKKWLDSGSFLYAMRTAIRYVLKNKFNKIIPFLISVVNNRNNSLNEWGKHILYSSNIQREALWQKKYASVLNTKSPLFERNALIAKKVDRLSFAQHMDYHTYLPCDILTKVDIASMSHGLEVRVPFVDTEVIKLVSELPFIMKNDKAVDLGTGKTVLKNILYNAEFSNKFLSREKQGFAVPRLYWFLENGEAYKLLKDVLTDKNSNLSTFFNTQYILALLKEHSIKNDVSGILWLLLVFGLWNVENKKNIF